MSIIYIIKWLAKISCLCLRWILLLCLFSPLVYSQGENNIWYLTNGLGVDFNTGTPEVLTDGKLSFVNFGVATVSDKNGNFLFYTDGRRIYDKNHLLMPNGDDLRAWYRATQAALIVPLPGSTTIFYVFSHTGTLRYSIVDLNLNSGNGDVVFSQKNIWLANNLTYKQVAAKGDCGSVWIITHELDNNRFLAFKLSNDGISNPVVSNVGSAHNNEAGQMKLSPDFTKLAVATASGFTELFDFDRTSGIVSNPIHLPTDQVGPYKLGAYGLSFSPNCQLLYVSEGASPPSPNATIRKIFQYDVSLASEQLIKASKTLVGEPDMISDHRFDLQLGPDSVIYFPRHNRLYLGAIQKPNNLGISCEYIDKGVYFGSGNFFSEGGLPNPVVVADPITVVETEFLGADTILCTGQSLEIEIDQPNASFLWSDGTNESSLSIIGSGTYWLELDMNGCHFYDTIQVDFRNIVEDLIRDTFLCSGQNLVLNLPEGEGLWQDGSTSNSFDVSAAGIYWVEIVDQEGCTIRDTAIVQNADGNILDLGQDTTLCDDLQFLISLPDGYNYEWQDGQIIEEYLITDSGIYWVEVQDGFGCIDRDSIEINFSNLPKPDLGSDTLICPGDTLILASNVFADNYFWNTTAQSDEIIITEPGEYWLQIGKEGCISSDTILINADPIQFGLGIDTAICKEDILILNLPIEGDYLWQDGQQGFEYQISQAGTYWVESQSGCKIRDSIQVDVIELEADIIYTDTVICAGEPVLLAIDNPETTYDWNTGSQDSYIIVQTPGIYTVSISQRDCMAVDSIEIYESEFTVDLGNDTTLCFDEILNLDASVSGASYLWQDGSNLPNIEVNQSGKYWVDVNMHGCVLSDTVNITKISFEIELGGDIFLCEGDEMLLDANVPGAAYEWQDGSNNPDLNISQSGIYWVEVSLNRCLVRDSVEVKEIEFIVNLGRDTSLCTGDNLVLDAYVSEASYLWQDGSSQSTLEFTEPGTYWVDVDLHGCMISDSIQINKTVFTVDLGKDTSLCTGQKLLLDANIPGATYVWQNGLVSPNIEVDKAGVYWVEVSKDGCDERDTIEILENNVVVNLGEDVLLCEDESTILDASVSGATYLWQDGSNDSRYNVNQTGIYWVEVQKDGCVDSDTIKVEKIEFTLDLGQDTVLCPGDEILLKAQVEDASYLWQDGSTDPNYHVTQPGMYWVEVSLNGCTQTDFVDIQNAESCGDAHVFVPNAFSPNGDGHNDEFRIYSNEELLEFSLRIYSRWGELIFESSDPDLGWDGYFNGVKSVAGVYVVFLSYHLPDDIIPSTRVNTLTLIW